VNFNVKRLALPLSPDPGSAPAQVAVAVAAGLFTLRIKSKDTLHIEVKGWRSWYHMVAVNLNFQLTPEGLQSFFCMAESSLFHCP
jgi:hypothetical protein